MMSLFFSIKTPFFNQTKKLALNGLKRCLLGTIIFSLFLNGPGLLSVNSAKANSADNSSVTAIGETVGTIVGAAADGLQTTLNSPSLDQTPLAEELSKLEKAGHAEDQKALSQNLDAYILGGGGQSLHPADYFQVIPQNVPSASWRHQELIEEYKADGLKSLEQEILSEFHKEHPELSELPIENLPEGSPVPRAPYHDELELIDQIAEARADKELGINRKWLRGLRVSDLELRTLDRSGNIISTISLSNKAADNNNQRGESIELWYRGKLVNQFKIAHSSLAYKNGVLFFKQEALNEISFIDLESFKKDIGRAPLPVFRISSTQWDDSNLFRDSHYGLRTDGNYLKYGNQEIEPRHVHFFREFQLTAFHASVALLDPAKHAEMADSIESFSQYWLHGKKIAEANLFDGPLENKPINDSVDQFFEKLHSHLQTTNEFHKKSVAYHPLKKEIDDLENSLNQATKTLETLEQKLISETNLSSEEKIALEDKIKTAQSEVEKLSTEYFQATKSFSEQHLEKFRETEDQKAQSLNLEKSLKRWALHKNYKSKLFTRLNYMWGKLSLPKPQGAATIKAGIVLFAAQMQAKTEGRSGTSYREAVLRIINNRYAKLLGTGIATYAAWELFPEQVWSATLYAANLFSNTLLVVYESVKSTVGSFGDPKAIYDAYFSSERRGKFAYGLTALTTLIAVTIFTPIVIVNSYYYAKSIPKHLNNGGSTYKELIRSMVKEKNFDAFNEFTEKAMNDFVDFFPKLWKGFIKEQDLQRKEFIKHQIAADAERTGKTVKTDWTPEEDLEAKKIAANLQQIALGKKKSSGVAADDGIQTSNDGRVFQTDITTMRQALANFIFGDSAFDNMHSFSVPAWSTWIGARTFWIKPHLLATMLYYPNFYRRVIPYAKNNPEKKLPEARGASTWNGGLTPFYEVVFKAIRNIPSRGSRAALKSFETKISDLELIIQKKVLQQTFAAMSRDIVNPDLLHQMFRVEGGFQRVSQKDLFKIKGAGRSYFAEYYNRVNTEAMRDVVIELSQRSNPDLRDLDSLSDRQLKNLAIKTINEFNISESEIESIVFKAALKTNASEAAKKRSIEAEAHGKNLFKATFAKVTHGLKNMKDLWTFNRVNSLASTPVIKRIQIASMQMQDPLARARGVRSTKTAFVIDKPMELALTFALLANVNGGLSQPMYDEQFGENSWNYLSRYVFLNAVISMGMSIHGDVWLKLQKDFFQQEDFGKAPQGRDAQRSFLKYFIKKTLNNPNNTLWKNHVRTSEIVFANMPAAFGTYVMMDSLSMGRFDLDMYMIGYLLQFGVPHYSSLANQIEQGFEGAAYHDLRHVPEKYLQHPAVQMALNDLIYKRRKTFNVWYNLFFNVYGIFWQKLATLNIPSIGPRSLARVIGGGYTPTEHVVNHLMKPVADTVEKATGIETTNVLEKCAKILTNNYTDGVRLKAGR